MDWSRFVYCVFAGGIAAFALGCGSGNDSSTEGIDCNTDTTFMPVNGSFDDFHDWKSYPVADAGDADSVHMSGPRTEYINALPPHGSTTFPVGTIIVKEVGGSDFLHRQIFAMAKRGGCYNEYGATNWAWLGITNASQTTATIQWDNVVPPATEVYASVPGADCNTCHKASAKNDFVQSKLLELTNF